MLKFCKEKWEENEGKFKQYVLENKAYIRNCAYNCAYKEFAQIVLNSILEELDGGMYWKIIGEYYTETNIGVWYAFVVDTLTEDIFITKINYVTHTRDTLLKCTEELEISENTNKTVELARQLIANLEPVYNTERWYRKK